MTNTKLGHVSSKRAATPAPSLGFVSDAKSWAGTSHNPCCPSGGHADLGSLVVGVPRFLLSAQRNGGRACVVFFPSLLRDTQTSPISCVLFCARNTILTDGTSVWWGGGDALISRAIPVIACFYFAERDCTTTPGGEESGRAILSPRCHSRSGGEKCRVLNSAFLLLACSLRSPSWGWLSTTASI